MNRFNIIFCGIPLALFSVLVGTCTAWGMV